ncbi:MAG: UvrD-helicase domain-containing protein [Bacteroidaceae bacterium]|nr:UvrD-helicase domain-containing protein [Bacteroidaceae bacterium]
MAFIMESFNPAQKAAVEYCDGPSLVIAGAGSGKTRVLTHKISYLLDEKGYLPHEILALTFTNKAANEMKERIAKILDDVIVTRRLWMGTFHSIFLRILRAEHESIGFSANFTIYDTADSKSLLKDIIKQMGLEDKTYKPAAVLGQISNAKNSLLTADEYVKNGAFKEADMRAKMPAIGDIYMRYSKRCSTSDAMDFDDILLYTYLLFSKNEDIRRKYVERFKYVLVDEYQDTNFAQHQIVWQLTKERQHVCVVGDDAQSIYSFRGANIDNILTFKDLYKDSKLFKLEQNYRSTQVIVEAANSLIRKNRAQIQKDVFSENERGELIKVTEAYSDIEEGQVVIRQIGQLRRKEGASYSDFAILYRTNAQSRVFEEALRKSGMPYKIYGGLSFYQRKEVKDVISYLRLTMNPNDEEALKRVINYPARGIGSTTIQKIIDCATENGVSLWSVVGEPERYNLPVTKATATKIGMFHALISHFIELSKTANAEEVGRSVVQECGILADIYQDKTPENLSRQENITELINGMHDFCETRLEEDNQNITISDYLSEVSLISDLDSDNGDNTDKVTMMTIHSAKGLEFPTVFIVGMEEGLFPSQMARTPREMEEERRLFYVAITRAERHCFLSYAKSRYHYGKMEFGTCSRFIRDIDSKFLDEKSGVGTARYLREDDEVELPWAKRRAKIDELEYFMNRVEEQSYTSNSKINSQKPRSFTPHVTSSKSKLVQPSSSIRNVSKVTNENVSTTVSKSPNEVGKISVGKHIEHQRFGIGVVMAIEGTGDNVKATINFNNLGKKQLLLKFARFTVID